MIPASGPKAALAILGTSLFAPEVVEIAEESCQFAPAVFIENWDRAKVGTTLLGRPIVWIDDARQLAETHLAVCALGTTRRRGFIDHAAALGFRFATLRHPSALVGRSSAIGEGCIISAGANVSAQAVIGRHVILHRGVLIGHHSAIGDCVTLAPGANVAGAVTIGAGAYIGIGAIVLDRLRIGARAVVGAGAVVTRDVPDGVQVVGVPARISKEGVDGR